MSRAQFGYATLALSLSLPIAYPQGMASPHSHPAPSPRATPGKAPAADFHNLADAARLRFAHVAGDPLHKTYLLESTGSGVAAIDFDNDGLTDLFFVNSTKWSFSPGENHPTSHLFRNLGHMQFEDVTKGSGLEFTGWGQGVCAGDYDNDGFTDLFVTYYGHNVLYRNTGRGRFEDVTHQAGLPTTGIRWGTGCSFVDYDRDGRLDIAIANYLEFDRANALKPGQAPFCKFKGLPVPCGPHGMKGGVNVLLHNDGNGVFRDVTRPSGFDKPRNYTCFSVLATDYDNDGWPDIFIACDSTPSILFHNNHDGTFIDRGVASGTAFNMDGEEQGSMGADLADTRHAGSFDLVKTNFDDDIPSFYRNEEGFFTDISYAAGLAAHRNYVGWGAGFFDYDNDGWPDLILTNGHVYPNADKLGGVTSFKQPQELFWNTHDGTFANLSETSGPGITAKGTGRGLAYADFANDGTQQVVLNNLDGPPALLVNRVHYPAHWIELFLSGTQSNRSAVGARVIVKAGSLVQTQEVRSGCCFLSQSDLRLHFGLGGETHVDSIEVRWPNGERESFSLPAVDRIVPIVEGQGSAM